MKRKRKFVHLFLFLGKQNKTLRRLSILKAYRHVYLRLWLAIRPNIYTFYYAISFLYATLREKRPLEKKEEMKNDDVIQPRIEIE